VDWIPLASLEVASSFRWLKKRPLSMKKKILIFLLPFLMVIGVGLAPRLLHLDRVRDRIVERLRTDLGNGLRMGEIRWHWLPVPYLSLHETTVVGNNFMLNLPETIIRPQWRSLLTDKFQLTEIVLNFPDLHIKSGPPAEPTESPALPSTRIIVNTGTVRIDQLPEIPGLVIHDPLRFSIAQSEVTLTPDRVSFYATGSSSLTKSFQVLGAYKIQGNSYVAQISGKDFHLHQGIDLAQGRILPLAGESNLTVTINGKGLQDISMHLQGQLPDFALKLADRQVQFDLGTADLNMEKSSGRITLRIKGLEIKEPGLNVYGKIERSVVHDSEAPEWHLDLKAGDINLTQVRKAILTLWENNRIADRVAGIVLGGEAKAGGFHFDGPASDFQKLEAMTITADVLSADIFVPGVNLDINRVKGKITIKDGILSGEDLSAGLEKSNGRNCSLLLGLGGNMPAFRLETDIEADLAALPPILARLVHHVGFRDELSKIGSVQGSAVGHLSIGDSLVNPTVKVTARDIAAQLQYARISWPILIENGTFTLVPGKASWEGINATAGAQILHGAAGSVVWHDEPFLTMELQSAVIDTAALFSELSDNGYLSAPIKQDFASVKGMANLQNGHLTGPALTPQKWTYEVSGTIEKFHWTSRLLPAPVIFNSAAFSFSSSKLTFSQGNIAYLEQPYLVNGSFKHTLFEHWQGSLTINGTLNSAAGDWLRQKEWIPAAYFPRLPCTLQNFKISWAKGRHTIAGTVLAGAGAIDAPAVTLDLVYTPEEFTIKEMTFKNNNQEGRLSLFATAGFKTYQLKWQGQLQAQTLASLFAKNTLISGNLRGEFQLNTATGPNTPFFDGVVEGKNLGWRWRKNGSEEVTLNFRAQGRGRTISIEELILKISENTLSLPGRVAKSDTGLELHLNLAADKVVQEDIQEVINDLQNKLKKLRPLQISPAADAHPAMWNLNGDISFSIGQLLIVIPPFLGKESKRVYRLLQPAEGRLEFLGRDGFSTHFTRAQLCGIDISGTLYAGNIIGEQGLNMTSADTLDLQEVLPCLGIKQDVIEGAFTLKGTLKGRPGDWTEGMFSLTSKEGRILRMQLLSKIFALVNITDIFTTSEPSTLGQKGFPYSRLDFQSTILNNRLNIKRAVIRGEGLNLFAKGELDLTTLDADITVLIAPLKTLDTIAGKVPLVGKAIGGKDLALVAIPVGVKGNIKEPELTLLPAQAVGEGILNIVRETLTLPFNILSPILTK
jgi:hypothetical protein